MLVYFARELQVKYNLHIKPYNFYCISFYKNIIENIVLSYYYSIFINYLYNLFKKVLEKVI